VSTSGENILFRVISLSIFHIHAQYLPILSRMKRLSLTMLSFFANDFYQGGVKKPPPSFMSGQRANFTHMKVALYLAFTTLN